MRGHYTVVPVRSMLLGIVVDKTAFGVVFTSFFLFSEILQRPRDVIMKIRTPT